MPQPDLLEAELKFDNEVLWCITQLEKAIKSGLNESKSKFLKLLFLFSSI